jgi:cytochrome c-type biogenesis protein CcmH/NrfF
MPAASPDDSPEVRKGYETVAGEVLCWCGCSRQTIYECTCGMAHEVRGQIESDLSAGRTPEELLAALVGEHGEAVRVVPPNRGFNRLAWAGPGAAILLAGAGVAWILIVWSKRQPVPPPLRPLPGGPAGEEAEEEYRRRLASDLSRLKR